MAFYAWHGIIFLIASFDYNVRESQRARNVTLKVSRRCGLEVVVPEGFDHLLLPEILASRENWITGQLARFDSLPGRFDENWPPRELSLQAAGVDFALFYQQVRGDRLRLSQQDTEIEISHPEDIDNESLVNLFVRWLKSYAKQHYASVAAELADKSGLPYKKLVVRGQKTRWGSYSSRGTLSLNYKLLFLPKPLLEHVILHELSHSVHMNHSDDFWGLLTELDPQTPLHDKQLSEAWKYLPPWLE